MKYGEALLNLSDIAKCVANDMHTMHLNFRGAEFDILHKEVLKTYYEEADNDYDDWAEAALMFEDMENVPNAAGAATRVEWKVFEGDCDRQKAIERVKLILEGYMETAVELFNILNKQEDCYRCIGVSNTLQTRIEYWSKELAYFNARRF